MTWKAQGGAAIAVHPFIASGFGQISLLTGDQFQICAQTDGWYLGRNLLTQISGIFPKCCVEFYPLTTIDQRILLSKKEDLLQTEAQLTIAYALHYIKDAEDPISVYQVTTSLQKVVEKLNIFRNKSNLDSIEGVHLPIDQIWSKHSDLAKALDDLRKTLGQEPAPRTLVHEYSILTTWGEEQFTIAHHFTQKIVIKPIDYVNFHVKIELISPKKTQFYRIFLYQKGRHPWISLPASRKLGPDNSQCDLLFTALEKKDMKEATYLVIYMFDIPLEEGKNPENFQGDYSLVPLDKRSSAVISRQSSNQPTPIPRYLSKEDFSANPDGKKPHSLNGPDAPIDISKPNECPTPRSNTHTSGLGSLLRRSNRSNSFSKSVTFNDTSYLNPENSDLFREIAGCAQLRFPSCKTDLALKRPTTTYNLQFKTSSSAEYLYGLHEPLIKGDLNCHQTLKNVLPEARISFTPFYGKSSDALEKEGLTNESLVDPLFLPSVMPAKTPISKVVFSVVGLQQHSSRKKSRIVCRVIDKSSNRFLRVIEDPFNPKCLIDSWSSFLFKGIKMVHLCFSESFVINIATLPPSSLSNLYFAVEIQRQLPLSESKFVSSSYTTIPLTTAIGNIHQVERKTFNLHHFQDKNDLANVQDFLIPASGSGAGSVDISINLLSTLISSFDPIYKLINFSKFESDIEDSLKNFTQFGLPEMLKFFSQITYSLLMIISTKKEFSKLAFEQLSYVFSEVLTRARPDYVKLLDEFINNLKPLPNLHKELIPRLVERIQVDDTTQEFRNIVKCSSYFLKISMKSINIAFSLKENVDLNLVMEQLEPFFNRFYSIVSDVPNENTNAQRRGFIFTNQQLIMQQFAKIVSALFLCISPDKVANIVIKFIKSIRYCPDDKKQVPIDKSKLKILHALASTKCWTDAKTRSILEQLYTDELMKAAQLPHCVTFIVPILSSLFLSVRNNFIVKFTNVLSVCYKSELDLSKNATSASIISTAKQNVTNMTRLLLIIAFTFPRSFQISYLLELVQTESLGANERMFVFSNAILAIKNKLTGPETPNELKVRVLRIYLELAILVSNKTNKALDDLITERVYPRINDYLVCRNIFESLPESLQISSNIVEPVLHCYMNDQPNDLVHIFIQLVKSHLKYESNHHNDVIQSMINPDCPDDGQNNILNKTLFAAFNLSKNENFFRIYKIYESAYQLKNELQLTEAEFKFLDTFHFIFKSFNAIREIVGNLDNVTRNEEKISDGIISMSKLCKSTGNKTILAHLIYEQAKLQMKVYNHLEACYSFMKLIKYIPCTLDPVPEHYRIDGAKNGVEVHRNVMIKCIALCEEANYEEYGLEIIKKLKETVIIPFKYYELMKSVLQKEANLYHVITTTERNYSSFYLLKFTGEGFDETYYRNKSYVYRKPYGINYNAMVNEISLKFPFARVGSEPAQNDTSSYIQIQKLVISNESEAQNPYARPSLNPQENHGYKYHFIYSLYKTVRVFRCESPVTLNLPSNSPTFNKSIPPDILKVLTNGTKQTFVFTDNSFPFMSTRIVVNPAKTVTRILVPIDTAILDLRRSSFDMNVEILQFKKIYENSVLDATTSAAMSNMTGKTSRARSPTLMKKLSDNGNDDISLSSANNGNTPLGSSIDSPSSLPANNSSGTTTNNANATNTTTNNNSNQPSVSFSIVPHNAAQANPTTNNDKKPSVTFAIPLSKNNEKSTSVYDLAASGTNSLKNAIESGSLAKFTTDLNNTLFDAIEGKVSLYTEAFLVFMIKNSSFLPFNAQKMSVLKEAYREKLYTLYRAIQISDTFVTDQMKGINDKNNENFNKLKNKIDPLIGDQKAK